MKKRLMILALSLAAAVPAAAQPEPSSSKITLVREFLEVTRTHETFARTLEAMLQSEDMGEDLPPNFASILREFFAEHLSFDVLEPGFIRMYSDLFTEEELRALIVFYRTPAGQRMVELTPEIAVRTQQITSEVMEEAMPALMEMMMEAMEEEEDEDDPPGGRES